ncbi:MAG: YeeE/YedE family protein [Clostridiaceae bacterium]|nr:YeeE/YedE family protein [Clostridiaceae bacterium]
MKVSGKFILKKQNKSIYLFRYKRFVTQRKGGEVLKNHDRILKKPWPYMVGGSILAILNIILFILTDKVWRVTSGVVHLGAYVLEKIGLRPSEWYYFSQNTGEGLGTGEMFIYNPYIIMNAAIIVGALLSTLWASEFKWKRIKSGKQFVFALLGGFLMGYATRLSFGCNIGGYFSAIPSFSLHGWVFALFMFVGAWVGSKILIKYLLT